MVAANSHLEGQRAKKKAKIDPINTRLPGSKLAENTQEELKKKFITISTFETISPRLPNCIWRLILSKTDLLTCLTFHNIEAATAMEKDKQRAMNLATQAGHLGGVQMLAQKQYGRLSLDAAAEGGQFEVVKWICDTRGYINCMDYSRHAVDNAARWGDLDIVKYLLENVPGILVFRAMSNAAGRGHLDIVKYLHEKSRQEDEKNGIYFLCNPVDKATGNSHLDVANLLHVHRKMKCTQSATAEAARKGFLEVLKYLYHHGIGEFTAEAVDLAALGGHLEVIKYLHAHGIGCSSNAVNNAARKGNMEILQWLHAHYGHQRWHCSTIALTDACGNGHWQVASWLLENYRDGVDVEVTFRNAQQAWRADFKTMKWLVTNVPEYDWAALLEENLEKYRYKEYYLDEIYTWSQMSLNKIRCA